MKVADLIKHLRNYPKDAEVLFQGANGWTAKFYIHSENIPRSKRLQLKVVGEDSQEEKV